MRIIPYQLQPGRVHRFGVEPTDNYQRILIQHWWELDKSTLSPEGVAFANDAYDDCIADLDEQIGKLVDELEPRGVLGRTWLIIASDHGESFGEHAGIFCHGKSLYEIRVARSTTLHPAGRKRDASGSERARQSARPGGDDRRSDRPAGRLAVPRHSLARLWKPPAPSGGVDPARHRVPWRSLRSSRTTCSTATPGGFPSNSLLSGP